MNTWHSKFLEQFFFKKWGVITPSGERNGQPDLSQRLKALRTNWVNRRRVLACVDIGSRHITTLISRWNSHTPWEIIGIGQCRADGIDHGIVNHVEKTTKAIAESVYRARKKLFVPVSELTIGINSKDTRVYLNILPVSINNEIVTQDDVQKAIEEAYALPLPYGYQIFEVFPVSYRVDNGPDIMDPAGMSGVRLEIKAMVAIDTTANMEKLNLAVANIRKYHIRNITYKPFATGQAILEESEKEIGACLLDIGSDCTDLVLFEAGAILDAATFPFGGNDVSRQLAKKFKMSFKEAERLKNDFGNCLAGKKADNNPGDKPQALPCPIPGTSVTHENLNEEIHRTMAFFLNKLRPFIENMGGQKRFPAGIVLTGGGSKLRGLPQLLGETLSVPIRNGGNLKLQGSVEIAEDPVYSGAMALTLKELNKTTEVEGWAPLAKFKHKFTNWLARTM